MKRRYIIYILLIIIQACSIDKDNNVTTIDIENAPIRHIITRLAGFEENTILPYDFSIVADSVLVVYEPRLTDNIINTYNINTCSLLKKFGKVGNGPEDFLLPRYIGDQLYHDKNSFSVGGSDKKIRNFRFSQADKDDTGFEQTITALIPNEMRQFNFMLVDNDSVLISSCTGEYQLSILDKRTNKIKYASFYPDLIETDLNPFYLNVNVYDAMYASNGEAIVATYINWNVVDIADLNGNLIKRILFPDYLFNKNELSQNENSLFTKNAKRFFGRVKVTPDYIFALNWNDTPINISEGNSVPDIYKLDWSGNLIEIYEFDRPIYNFCLRGNDIIYVTAPGDDGETYIMSIDYK